MIVKFVKTSSVRREQEQEELLRGGIKSIAPLGNGKRPTPERSHAFPPHKYQSCTRTYDSATTLAKTKFLFKRRIT